MSNTLIHRSSGNVYKDLGFPDAEEMQAKAMYHVIGIILLFDYMRFLLSHIALFKI